MFKSNKFQHIPLASSTAEPNIDALYNKAKELLITFNKKVEQLSAQLKAATDSYSHNSSDLLNGATGQDKQILQQAAKRATASNIIAARRQLEESSREQRNGILNELADLAKNATVLDDVFASPIFMLSLYGLGSTEKSKYLEELENQPVTQLENTAKYAILTGNRFLGSAILAVIESAHGDKRKSYGDLRHHIADAFLGEEFKQFKAKLAAIQQAFNLASQANRELWANRGDPYKGLSLALTQRSLDEILMDVPSPLDPAVQEDVNIEIRAISNSNNMLTLPDGTVLGHNVIPHTAQPAPGVPTQQASTPSGGSLDKIRAGITQYNYGKSDVQKPAGFKKP